MNKSKQNYNLNKFLPRYQDIIEQAKKYCIFLYTVATNPQSSNNSWSRLNRPKNSTEDPKLFFSHNHKDSLIINSENSKKSSNWRLKMKERRRTEEIEKTSTLLKKANIWNENENFRGHIYTLNHHHLSQIEINDLEQSTTYPNSN